MERPQPTNQPQSQPVPHSGRQHSPLWLTVANHPCSSNLAELVNLVDSDDFDLLDLLVAAVAVVDPCGGLHVAVPTCHRD